MSTLDPANNSNGEVPTHLWDLAKKFPRDEKETPGDYYKRLVSLNIKNSH
jgi:hypothetical protein